MKLIGRLVKIVLVLVVLLVVAAVIFAATFDANSYKPQIERAVQEQIGRDLRIAGDIDLSLFPWLGLDLGAVALGNAPGFGDEPFARTQEVNVKVKLLPLLRKELIVSQVVVRGLELDLQRRPDGTTNWDDLVEPAPGAPPAEPAPEAEPAPPGAEGGPPLAALAIGGVEIRDARVSWQDAQAGQPLVIDPLDLSTGRLEPGEPFPLELSVTVKGEQPAVDADLHLEAVADLDLEAQRYRVRDLALTVDGRVGEMAGDVPVETVVLELQGEVDARMAEQAVDVAGLVLAVKARGPAEQAELRLTGQAAADLAAQTLRLGDLDLSLAAEGGGIPGGEARARLTARQARADLAAQTAAVEGLALTALDTVRLAGDVSATRILQAPQARGTLTLEPFSPREAMARLDIPAPETADPEVLKRLAGEVAFTAGTDSAALESLSLALDQTNLTGSARVSGFAQPAIGFDLAVDAIDVDRYLPPPPPEGTEPAPAGTEPPAGDGTLGIPVEPLRELNLEGKARIGRLKANNLRFSDVDVTVTAKDGLVQIRPLSLALYDGRLQGSSTIDVRGETPKFQLTQQLEGLQAGPLLADLMGDDKLRGLAMAQMDLSTEGQSIEALKAALDGTMSFRFRDGAIKGFNLRHMLESAEARLKGNAVPDPVTQETDFSAISVSAVVEDGRLRSSDLDFLSPFLRGGGEGWVDLAKQTLDYTARVAVVATREGQGGAGLEDLKGLTIPVRLKGSFSDPDYDIKLGEALKAAATEKQKARLEAEKQKLRAEEEAQKQELEQKLEREQDKLKDKLRKLF